MATRGSILSKKGVVKAPIKTQMPQAPARAAPVAMQYPDIAQLQREAAARNIPSPQPQQPSGLRALSPQEFRSVPQQPAMSQDAFAKQQADVLKFFQAQQKVPQPQMTEQQKAYIEKSRASVPMETAQPIMPQQPKTAAQTAAFNKGQQASAQNFNKQSSSLIGMPTQRADENFLKQQETAMRGMTTQAAQQAEAMGPKMPGMKKGGVVKKKPGYAKGGVAAKKAPMAKYAKGGMVMANCGASMKPQQRKK